MVYVAVYYSNHNSLPGSESVAKHWFPRLQALWVPAWERVVFTPVIPGFTPVIPGFTPVIPAKAGIYTDSPPEPYCPVPLWPCHPREGRDQLLALDSRLRGNDDLRAWERAVGVLRQPQSEGTSC
ncbi:hypothetical protein [Endozoicomonas sp. 8E]|uniref:hypothetical protein n=1 Tax=Endozoicomonas sp. 8E TaxID=3035692 RepID=UPI002938D7BA|nr:hypothetical protein [Endozoicomonas sp. 8E]WOG25630.1 hypothetical protein P6910_13670 [Endozoicomonas sp. 8E]